MTVIIPPNRPDWCHELSQRVKLLIPAEYEEKGAVYCTLRLDDEQNVIDVICQQQDRDGGMGEEKIVILDRIDIDDMIGAQYVASTTHKHKLLAPTIKLFTYPRQDLSRRKSCLSRKKHTHHPNPEYTKPADLRRYGNRVARPVQFVVASTVTIPDAMALAQALHTRATGRMALAHPPQYLVFVNPVSGPKKNGLELAEQIIIPMLQQSGAECELFVTQNAKHATHRVAEQEPGSSDRDLLEYNGLILVGGDGVIHEVLNGIMVRKDHEKVLNHIICGVVGCGTANGLATSICLESNERYGPVDETYLIAKGRVAHLDVSEYHTRNRKYYSFLTLSWAMIADVDIESECIRWLGESRFDLWAVLRVLTMRKYRGRLSYLPSDRSIEPSEMPRLTDPVPDSWTVIEDDISLFWASHIPHAAVRKE